MKRVYIVVEGQTEQESKRLLAIKPDYNKVLEGNLIALEIGIQSILEKCPRFAGWVKAIIGKAE